MAVCTLSGAERAVTADEDGPPSPPSANAARAKLAKENAEFERRVSEAIDRGAKWLGNQQAKDGTWGAYISPAHTVGLTALCVQTLATCGADESNPRVKAGLKLLAKEFAPPLRVAVEFEAPVFTYSAATAILCYEALYAPRLPAKSGPPAAATAPVSLPAPVRRQVKLLVDWLVESQKATGWRYPLTNAEGGVDLSNSVYALMALQSAARCGIDVAPGVYATALAYVLMEQTSRGPLVRRWLPNPAYLPWAPDGSPYVDGGEDEARGWAYLPRSSLTSGSMTSAGVAALAIIRDRLGAAKRLDAPTRASIDAVMLSGIAWLGANFDVRKNPGPDGPCWHRYHLYGLERAGALAGVPNFGQHDWYREGAEHLLATQDRDGGWSAAAPGVTWAAFQPRAVETCFALLFLRRGTTPPASPIGATLTPGSSGR